MSEPGSATTRIGIGIGALFVLIGIAAYVLSDFASVTALIPAFFGVIIVALGIVGWQTDNERIAIYAMGVLAAISVAGSGRGIPDILSLLGGESVDSVIATTTQALTIVLGLTLLVIVVGYLQSTR